MGFTLAPRDLNGCCNPKVDQRRQNLRTVDCTTAWLDAVNPCDPWRRVVDLSGATFMDDISRIQNFAAPPSVAEIMFKMNRAHSLVEESPGEGDWTLNASKTANVIMMRGEERTRRPGGWLTREEGCEVWLARGTTSRTLLEGECEYYGRNWKESYSDTKRMETMRQVLQAKVPKRVKRLMFISFVQGAALSGLTSMVLEPRHCTHLDRVLLGMLRSLLDCASNVERNQTEESKNNRPFLGPVAGCGRVASAKGTMVPELG